MDELIKRYNKNRKLKLKDIIGKKSQSKVTVEDLYYSVRCIYNNF